jgi:MYXO-CTERM domain-containing protein
LRNSFARLASASLAAVAVTAIGAPAGAVTSDLCDFSSVSTLQMVGNAATASPNLLRLTSNNGDQTGAAWLTSTIPIVAGTSVHTYFRFRLSNDCGLGGGDGLTFTLQGAGSDVLGSGGSALGYGQNLIGNGGINPSFAVELLVGQITNSAQVALLANGNQNSTIASASPAVAIDSGNVVYVWIDFDGSTNQVAVSMAGSASRPATPLFTGAANLAQLGGTAWAGFTAATSLTTCSDQDILEWDVSTDGSPCCATAPGGACSGATPVCGATGVCVASSSSSASGTGGSGSGTGGAGHGTGGSGSGTGGSGSGSGGKGASGSSSSSASGTGGAGTGGVGTGVSSTSTAVSTSSGGGAGGAPVGSGSTPEGAIVEGGGCSCRASGAPVSATVLALGVLATAAAAVRRRRR